MRPVKRVKIGMMAAAAMLATSGAQAASGVMDFEGFTITYDSSGQWSQGGKTDESAFLLADTVYDMYGSHQLDTGVRQDIGTASFGTSAPLEVKAYGGQTFDALNSSFKYTIQAKAGWELSSAFVSLYQSGTFLEFKGGSVSISGAGNGGATGGHPWDVEAQTNYFPAVSSASQNAGTWGTNFSQYGSGNNAVANSEWTFDSHGNLTVQTVRYAIDNVLTPFTSMGAGFNQMLSASTTTAPQVAFIDGTPGEFSINVTALRSVSPVPESDAYAMVAASLGLIGFAARRKAKKAA